MFLPTLNDPIGNHSASDGSSQVFMLAAGIFSLMLAGLLLKSLFSYCFGVYMKRKSNRKNDGDELSTDWTFEASPKEKADIEMDMKQKAQTTVKKKEEGQQLVPEFSIFLIGHAKVGKKSLVRAFAGEEHCSSNGELATTPHPLRLEHKLPDGTDCVLLIWYKTTWIFKLSLVEMRDEYLARGDAFIYVFAMNDNLSMYSLAWLKEHVNKIKKEQQKRQKQEDSDNIDINNNWDNNNGKKNDGNNSNDNDNEAVSSPICLCANKSDISTLRGRQISSNEAKEFTCKHNFHKLFKTTAYRLHQKNDEKINKNDDQNDVSKMFNSVIARLHQKRLTEQTIKPPISCSTTVTQQPLTQKASNDDNHKP